METGFSTDDLNEVRNIAESQEITDKMDENKAIIQEQLHVKGIPTMIYDNKKHTGLFEL